MSRREQTPPREPAEQMQADAAPEIELHIDQLVLHGFPESQRQRIGEEMQRELHRLLAERGLPARLAAAESGGRAGHTKSLRAGAFQLTAHTGPQVTGQRIAQSVFNALLGTMGPRGTKS